MLVMLVSELLSMKSLKCARNIATRVTKTLKNGVTRIKNQKKSPQKIHQSSHLPVKENEVVAEIEIVKGVTDHVIVMIDTEVIEIEVIETEVIEIEVIEIEEIETGIEIETVIEAVTEIVIETEIVIGNEVEAEIDIEAPETVDVADHVIENHLVDQEVGTRRVIILAASLRIQVKVLPGIKTTPIARRILRVKVLQERTKILQRRATLILTARTIRVKVLLGIRKVLLRMLKSRHKIDLVFCPLFSVRTNHTSPSSL